MRDQRKALSEAEQETAALAVAAAALPFMDEANTVAGYFAIHGELSVTELMRQCRKRQLTTCVPLLSGTSLVFSAFDDLTSMSTNRFNITEPVDQDSTLNPEQLDVVLVPLVGFDVSGNRLGMGGGFYDRSFEFRMSDSEKKPLLIGVAYQFQQVDTLPAESWDVPLDMIITESSIIDRR